MLRIPGRLSSSISVLAACFSDTMVRCETWSVSAAALEDSAQLV